MDPDDTLEQWKADEQRVRGRLRADDGRPPTLNVMELSGMALFDAIFAGELAPPPMGDTLDFVPIHIAPGIAVFQGRPRRRHHNLLGTVHGGWLATLLDSAMACAVHSSLPAGKACTTMGLQVHLVRPLTDAVPLVRAEGQLIHAGRQVGTAEGRIVGPDGRLYAHATTSCMIVDVPATPAGRGMA